MNHVMHFSDPGVSFNVSNFLTVPYQVTRPPRNGLPVIAGNALDMRVYGDAGKSWDCSANFDPGADFPSEKAPRKCVSATKSSDGLSWYVIPGGNTGSSIRVTRRVQSVVDFGSAARKPWNVVYDIEYDPFLVKERDGFSYRCNEKGWCTGQSYGNQATRTKHAVDFGRSKVSI
jgi:hypothetical protein